jgi:transcriptional regulator with XRE-family HTH domain
VSARPSPTVRSRRLRYELRRLRAASSLTIEAAADRAEVDAGTLSRWESGARHVRPNDLRVLLDIYEVTGEEREALLALGREARQRGWWHAYRGDAIPEWFQVYIGLEAEATAIRGYESELVHGLLQTPGYYEAFMSAAPAVGDDETIARKIAVRTERQELLKADDAPELWVILNEAVIRRVVGGPSVMRAQLEHVQQMAALKHITVQVLPFRCGAHPAMDGSFSILGYPAAQDPDVAYVEAQVGSLFLERPNEVERYDAMWRHLVAKAAGPDESAVMVAEAAADLA